MEQKQDTTCTAKALADHCSKFVRILTPYLAYSSSHSLLTFAGLSALILLHGAGEVLAFTSLMGAFTSHPVRAIKSDESGWKCAFMASFLLTTQVLVNVPGFMSQYGGVFDPATFVPLWVVAVSGLLAGYGTKMANGCTSGHGISGIGRLSVRSIVAVCTFMGTAFLSATLCSQAFPRINKATRHVNEEYNYFSKVAVGFGIFVTALFCVATITNLVYVRRERKEKQQTKHASEEFTDDAVAIADSNKTTPEQSSSNEDVEAQQSQAQEEEQQQQEEQSPIEQQTAVEEDDAPPNSYLFKMIAAMCAAPVFAFGLVFGGMTKPSKIIGFFDLTGFTRSDYDPSLMFLFAAGCAVSFVAYQFVASNGVSFLQARLGDKVRTKALSGDEYHLSRINGITKSLVIGSALFGVSLGIAGFCPTPSFIMAVGGYSDAMFIWLPLFIAGRFFHMFCFGDSD